MKNSKLPTNNADSPAFNVKMLLEYIDPTRGVPLETHRSGITGQVLLLSKRLFRATCQPLINEMLGRQRLFNRYVSASYAQMAAEVQDLRRQVEVLSTSSKRKVKATTPKS